MWQCDIIRYRQKYEPKYFNSGRTDKNPVHVDGHLACSRVKNLKKLLIRKLSSTCRITFPVAIASNVERSNKWLIIAWRFLYQIDILWFEEHIDVDIFLELFTTQMGSETMIYIYRLDEKGFSVHIWLTIFNPKVLRKRNRIILEREEFLNS